MNSSIIPGAIDIAVPMSDDADSLDLPIVHVPAIFKGDAAPAPEVPDVEYLLRSEECSIKKLPVPVYATDKVPDLAPFPVSYTHLTLPTIYSV